MESRVENSTGSSAIARRTALGVIAGAAGLAVLWPREPRSRRAIPSGRVVLRYWEKWTGPEGDAIQHVVDRFNESQDRIWVQLVPVADPMSKAMVAIGGGDPPDVIGLFSYNVPQFAEARAAMPFDAFSSGSGMIDTSIYKPAVAKMLSHAGRQWAGVNTCYTLALYCNRSLLASVGAHAPPRTIAELDELSGRLDQRDTAGRLSRVGFLPSLPSWWPYFWPIMFGGSLYDAVSDRATVASPECVGAYEWISRCASRIGPSAAGAFANSFARSFHSPDDPFIAGHTAMIVQGPWLANFLRRYAPALDYVAVPVPLAADVPEPEVPRGMLEADVLIIPRGCPHPEESFAFLRYMQTREVQEQLALEHCKSSPMARVSESFMREHPNRSVAVHDAITASPRVEVLPQTPAWQPYADLMIGAFDEIWSGGDTRAILTRVQARAQSIIEKGAVLRARRAKGSA